MDLLHRRSRKERGTKRPNVDKVKGNRPDRHGGEKITVVLDSLHLEVRFPPGSEPSPKASKPVWGTFSIIPNITVLQSKKKRENDFEDAGG